MMLRSLEREQCGLTFCCSQGLSVETGPFVNDSKSLLSLLFCSNPITCTTQDLDIISKNNRVGNL
eukprot:5226211-Amphidinium_carterae.2